MEKLLLQELLAKLPEQAVVAAEAKKRLTKLDFYEAGLSGRPQSAERRKALAHRLGVPDYLSANALLDYCNTVLTAEEFYALVHQE